MICTERVLVGDLNGNHLVRAAVLLLLGFPFSAAAFVMAHSGKRNDLQVVTTKMQVESCTGN